MDILDNEGPIILIIGKRMGFYLDDVGADMYNYYRDFVYPVEVICGDLSQALLDLLSNHSSGQTYAEYKAESLMENFIFSSLTKNWPWIKKQVIEFIIAVTFISYFLKSKL